jgi:predicted amidohydrolase YtcJ
MGAVHYGYGIDGERRAIVVSDGRIVHAGREEAGPAVAPDDRRIDIDAALAVAGFVDSHVHFGALALLPTRVDLASARSLREAVDRVRAHAERMAPGEWIIGRGWDKNTRPEDRVPTAADLDPVLPHTPVMLFSRCGHAGWVNSAALAEPSIADAVAGMGADRVPKDARTGRPTGLLLEEAADAAYAAIPRPPTHRMADLLEQAAARAHRHGIMAVHDMSGMGDWEAFAALRDQGRLGLRVTMSVTLDEFDDALRSGVRYGEGDEWLRVGPLKLHADGALGTQTAYMLEPYEGSESRGIEVLGRSELRKIVGRAHRHGFPVAIHAIGDAAVRSALDAIEAADGPPPPFPDRIEHAQLVHPADMPRFARLRIVASMQPGHIPGDIAAADRHWGDRVRWAYPVRTLIDSGARVRFGTDAPIIGIDTLATVRAAARRTPSGRADEPGWVPEETVTVAQALSAYSIGSDGWPASLAPGEPADFALLSHDILRDPQALDEAHITATVAGGRLLWRE